LGRRPLGAILLSSNEPGELSQWLCHDDITINIVVLIIIIIIIITAAGVAGRLYPSCGFSSADCRCFQVSKPCRTIHSAALRAPCTIML